ncbi:MAG: dihydrofolate reductase family protein [Trueperaceae bacterium]|nr:dihydrofolate reductase family protein [Trueperaceae bacterium]
MGRLIYSVICSLDGYFADAEGKFGWAYPGEEVLAAINDEMESVGTYLYGRKIYEMMTGWETDAALAASTERSGRFAEIWQAADKVVYSTTLEGVSTKRTRLERSFERDAVEALKESTDRDLAVDGPTLAASALRLGLVDDLHLVLCPIVVGGGLKVLPPDVRLELELKSERRFGNGMVQVRYRVP